MIHETKNNFSFMWGIVGNEWERERGILEEEKGKQLLVPHHEIWVPTLLQSYINKGEESSYQVWLSQDTILHWCQLGPNALGLLESMTQYYIDVKSGLVPWDFWSPWHNIILMSNVGLVLWDSWSPWHNIILMSNVGLVIWGLLESMTRY